MEIDIQARGFSLTDSLSNHIRHQLRTSLNRRTDSIRRVTVRLYDVNGPRGGRDKRCQMEVELENAPYVVIRDTRANLYAAVSLAADRCRRVITRHLSRRRLVPIRRQLAAA